MGDAHTRVRRRGRRQRAGALSFGRRHAGAAGRCADAAAVDATRRRRDRRYDMSRATHRMDDMEFKRLPRRVGQLPYEQVRALFDETEQQLMAHDAAARRREYCPTCTWKAGHKEDPVTWA